MGCAGPFHWLAIATLLSVVGWLPAVASASTSTPTTSIADLNKALEQGELSCGQIVEFALADIERLASLNAFITVDRTGARAAARRLDESHRQGVVARPLHCIPVAVKDNIHVAGLPNSGGNASVSRLRPRGGRSRGGSTEGRRSCRAGQDQHARTGIRNHGSQCRLRCGRKRTRPSRDLRRQQQRYSSGGSGWNGSGRAGYGHRGKQPDPGGTQWDCRIQTDPGPVSGHRAPAHFPYPGHDRTHGPYGGGCCAAGPDHG